VGNFLDSWNTESYCNPRVRVNDRSVIANPARIGATLLGPEEIEISVGALISTK